jgi:Fanconi-associated nuclease 1
MRRWDSRGEYSILKNTLIHILLFIRVHSEGSIVSTLFSLLFWDILFATIPGAFETPYQTAPLDLWEDSFYWLREDLIKARVQELESGRAAEILKAVDERERSKNTWCVGVQWTNFSQEDLLEVIEVSKLTTFVAKLTSF